MARPKNTTTELVPDVQLDDNLAENLNTLSTLQAGYNDERDLLNQLLGQAQMAGAFEDFSRTVRTSKLAFVKENKLYRNFKGSQNPHGAEKLSGTWEEFCSLLGRSVDQVDRDIANLSAFGEEALESMSRMGIGYRELRQYRKLPEDQKLALIEVAKEGDKAALVDLAEELIARHTKEKGDISKRLTETESELESSRQRAAALKTSKDELEEKLHEVRFKPITDDELAERCRLEATSISSKIVRELMGALNGAFIELEKDTVDRGVEHSSFMAGLVREMRDELDAIATRFSIPNLEAVAAQPDWLSEKEE